MLSNILAVILIFLLLESTGYCQIEVSAQADQSATVGAGSERMAQAHLRLFPKLNYSTKTTDWFADAELTGHLWATAHSHKAAEDSEVSGAKFHRLWLRLYKNATELRAGIQKINFGPAKILRSLRWFDQIDPSDPTGFTEGIKGLLLRHYFEDDSNLWAWGLYANEDPVGPAPLLGSKDAAELGGRYQFNLGNSEIGISAHRRLLSHTYSISPQSEIPEENRLAVDGNWDLGAPLWIESTLISISNSQVIPQKILMTTLGSDYTFDIGNGIYSSVEIQATKTAMTQYSEEQTHYVAALSHSYATSLLDQFRLIALKCLNCSSKSIMIDYQRTYDSVLCNAALFYHSSGDQSPSTNASRMGSIEKGMKITLQLNI